jgi:PAS domain S-box-containing protein
MKDEKKTKKQLIEELAEMHQRAAELNAAQTELKQADKLLRKSEERFRTQYQNIPIPTYTWQRAGEDFILVDYNKAGAIMTSGTISDLKGVKASKLYNDRPEIIADFSHCFDKRTVLKKEMSYRLKTTGEDKHLAVSYAFVPPDLVQVHTEDITSRKQAEIELRESEERFRRLVETMRDGLGVQDENGLITYVNERACELSGYSRDELIGRPAVDLIDEPFRKMFAEEFSRRQEGESSSYEITWRRKDGSKLPAIMASTPLFDSKGRFRGSFGVITDITQRKKAEEDLRKREAELAAQSRHLEEVNAALRVLLKQRKKDKADIEEKLLANVKELVLPYVEKLKNSRLHSDQMTLVGILESNMKEIVSPFVTKLSSRFLNLTPTEIRVASLIKDGKSSKEIAALLNASENTVRSHRFRIRSKLGIKNKKINFRSYLQSIQD